jgi:hypothetical protein
MKKVLFLLLTVITVCSCYNDDDLWDKVNDLDGRVETLETTVKGMNSDITALQNLVDALNQGKVIIDAEETENGYTLIFSDNSKVLLQNGTNGSNGADAPVIGVKADEDGVYYWTITTNGITSWLPDEEHKLKVTGNDGANGVTPIMGVDSEGYWTVDTGEGAQRIGGDHPVKAEGKDGDSFFKSVTVGESNVTITLADGTLFTLPKANVFGITIEDNDSSMHGEKTKIFKLKFTGVEDCFIVTVSNDWKATLNGTELTVTSPSAIAENNRNCEIKFMATDSEGTCKMIKLNVCAYELRILTFEDEDYKGNGNYVGGNDWSSLIDKQQYGGPLLYGESGMGPTDYNWYDENNTFLQHEFPSNYGTTCYWGGGHAISNYVETNLANGDFQHQLSVCYQNPQTGFGGHNGSKNFCVHYGYKDNSDFNMTEFLPSIYFGDGVARVVDHMYVMWNTYLANCVFNGNSLTDPVGPDDYVKLTAIGFDENGEEIKEHLEFFIAGKNGNISEWTRWDLSPLGKVLMIQFNVGGSNDNGYGFSQPAYFCYDDVAVRF